MEQFVACRCGAVCCITQHSIAQHSSARSSLMAVPAAQPSAAQHSTAQRTSTRVRRSIAAFTVARRLSSHGSLPKASALQQWAGVEMATVDVTLWLASRLRCHAG